MNHQQFYQNKTIWLTGASTGIGASVAHKLSQFGARVMISSRSEQSLHVVASTMCKERTLVFPMDVCDKFQNQDAIQALEKKWGALDIVIFNAGNAEYVEVDQFDSSVFERMIDVNFLAMVYGIEAALPLIKKSKNPQIVGMSSIVAFGGIPRSEAYGASKAAVKNFLEGLRAHLYSQKIKVSAIYPGFVKTPLTDKNDFPMPFLITSERAAEEIVVGIAKQKDEIFFPKRFTTLFRLLNLLPRSIYTKIMQKTVRQA
jgi:short-subunit dehydrogenase